MTWRATASTSPCVPRSHGSTPFGFATPIVTILSRHETPGPRHQHPCACHPPHHSFPEPLRHSPSPSADPLPSGWPAIAAANLHAQVVQPHTEESSGGHPPTPGSRAPVSAHRSSSLPPYPPAPPTAPDTAIPNPSSAEPLQTSTHTQPAN